MTTRLHHLVLIVLAALVAALVPVTAHADPNGSAGPLEGPAVSFGSNSHHQGDLPPLPDGTFWKAFAGGETHSLGLRSDGKVVGFGNPSDGRTAVPDEPGVAYTAVAAGTEHSLVLRSDGTVVAFGRDHYDRASVPALPAGLTYTGIAGGMHHSVFLRSNGSVVATGYNGHGQTSVPKAPAGTKYTAVAAGASHTLALRSDGRIIAVGRNNSLQVDVPALPSGVRYTSVSAGFNTSAAVRTDGRVVVWGHDWNGSTAVPALPEGTRYTAVAAGGLHTLALRSDGVVVAFGSGFDGQDDVPTLASNRAYAGIAAGYEHSFALYGERTTTTATTTAVRYGDPATIVSVPRLVDGPAVGTVVVRSGARELGRTAVNLGGQAVTTVDTRALGVGTHPIEASYLGQKRVAPSRGTTTLRISKARPAATATLVAKKTGKGKRAKLRITVGPKSLAATGTVRILDGSKRIATTSLWADHAGRRTVTLPKLGPGKHRLRISYVGSANIKATTSGRTTLTVKSK